MNFKARLIITGLSLAIASASLIFPGSCLGQRKYKSPEDAKVKKIADAAADYLKSSGINGIENRAVCALAVLEYHKRYDGAIPSGVGLVDDAVRDVAKMASDGDRKVFNNREAYFPSVAAILLAEYDSKKYKKQVTAIIESLVNRQLDTGAFAYLGDQRNDTSQSQFVALAFFVARQHRIPLDPEVVGKLLGFYVEYQAEDGSWNYQAKLGDVRSTGTNSIHSASVSSVYLLADLLKLQRRVKKMSTRTSVDAGLGLPKNVTVYIPPKVGNNREQELEAAWDKGGAPVVSFDKGKLSRCKNAADSWYQSNFQLPIDKWNSYFMYALERYAWFKEQADGKVGGALSSWYDDGVDYISNFQDDDGSIPGHKRVPIMTVGVNTALSLLFLVRASEVISLPPFGGGLEGFDDLGDGPITVGKSGRPMATGAQASLNDLISTLSDKNLDDRQLKQLTQAMKRSIQEFKTSDEKSRGEVTAFLRTMISDRNYYRRLIAIKFLSGQQDLDNVPALLYAMGDPNPKIGIEAHNGLRLISRKFETFVFEDKGNRQDNLLELARLKRAWTKWFLEIRPDAELLE